MGGMAAQIPIKRDPAANEAALARVLADKEREAGDGHDGTQVAHPGLVAHRAPGNSTNTCRRRIKSSDSATTLNVSAKICWLRPDRHDHRGRPARKYPRSACQYLEAWSSWQWLRAALQFDGRRRHYAEISRAQIWQWLAHNAALADGRNVTTYSFTTKSCHAGNGAHRNREYGSSAVCNAGNYSRAAKLFSEMSKAKEFAEFLTLPAYELID